jgi:hypothetical protein
LASSTTVNKELAVSDFHKEVYIPATIANLVAMLMVYFAFYEMSEAFKHGYTAAKASANFDRDSSASQLVGTGQSRPPSAAYGVARGVLTDC